MSHGHGAGTQPVSPRDPRPPFGEDIILFNRTSNSIATFCLCLSSYVHLWRCRRRSAIRLPHHEGGGHLDEFSIRVDASGVENRDACSSWRDVGLKRWDLRSRSTSCSIGDASANCSWRWCLLANWRASAGWQKGWMAVRTHHVCIRFAASQGARCRKNIRFEPAFWVPKM